MTLTAAQPEAPDTPELPTGVITVQPPPDKVEPQGVGNIIAMALPMMGSMGVMVFMALQAGSDVRMLLMGGAMVVAMLALVGFNIHRQVSTHRNQVMTTRREYLAYLSELRTTVRTAATQQRRFTSWHMPDPRTLGLIAEERSRLWERDSTEEQALTMRLGSSTQDLSMVLEEPELPPLANPDPVCHSAMHRFVMTHRQVDDMPFGVALGSFSHIEVGAPPEQGRAAARAMVAHLATFVPPTALKVAVLCSEEAKPAWEWAKWLPHARSSEVTDALGPARMVVTDPADLADLLGPDVTTRPAFEPRGPVSPWPHVVVIVDDATLPPTTQIGSRTGASGVTVIQLRQQWGALTSFSTLRMVLHPAAEESRPRMEVLLLDNEPIVAVPDQLSVAQAEAVARRLAPWSADELPDTGEAASGRSDPKRSADLMDLLGLGDVRDFDPERQWRRREGRERLRVPFAVTPEGVPVVLDIKESAQYGMGPHGLLIGATGSGKSEVLRTLVLALTLTHSPEQLNLVLVDFKGGATFAGMADLPHVSAMISNLESELSLVDRMQDAIRGEMVRRQELLREAGNYANVTDYEAARLAGRHAHPPLPALFLVLDEFSELLSAKPEFIDLFVAVGRLGRSMAIHLLLASQRLEEGRLRGLESHLSYRIGLRTFSAQESRAVLGVTDAYELPSIPGVGLLSSGTGSLTQFRASYVAAPPAARRADARGVRQAGAAATPIRVLPFTVDPQLDLATTGVAAEAAVAADALAQPGDVHFADMTQLDIAVERMRGHGTPAHQIWLPPLEVPDTLDALFGDLAVDPQLGLVSPSWRARGWLQVPLGIVDLPLEQRREMLSFDLSGAGGHLAVVGGPLSGKSTALRTLVMALSLTHTPREVQFFVLDFGGGSFAAFEGAAHIAGVATRDQPDVVRRTIAELEGILDEREKYFRAQRIDSMGTYRTRRARGEVDDGYGDVFLVVDGWSNIRSDFEDLEPRIMTLMGRALTFGVHLVVGASRWLDMRQQVRDIIGSKLEMRLGDTSDSEIDRKVAAQVPDKRPGRGLEVGGHHVMVALPRADGDSSVETLSDGVRDTLDRIAGAWGGQAGPRLRLLPERIELDAARALAPDERRLVLGVEESRLGPLLLDPRTEAFWYLLGDAKSGKTNFLRTVAHEVMRTHTPQQAQLFVVDLRRSLLGEVPSEYLTHYLTSRDQAAELFGELARYLKGRLPGEDITPEQLRSRSWWSGADIWILVDDYDLVATASGNPLAALQPLMGQAVDIGLHIVVARRSGGAARAMYESMMQTMVELGGTGVLLSGSPDEGPVIGRVKMRRAVPGRAQVISRDAGQVAAHLAWTPPAV